MSTATSTQIAPKLPPMTARGSTPQERVLWMAMFVKGVNNRRGLPYVLVGRPGSAKTSVARQMAYKANLPFESVLGSLRSPVDFLGVPTPRRMQLTPVDQHLSPDGELEFTYMHYAPAGFSVRAAKSKNAVILLDEVNTCPPSVQAALLRVLFEGVVGELELPPGVRIFLAMNETKEAAGGWDIAPPLANRMGWIDWQEPTPESFSQYLLTEGKYDNDRVNPIQEEQDFDARWTKAWAMAAGQVSGFLARKRDMLLTKPGKGKDASRAWASPRTWEMAARASAGASIYGFTDIESEMACSAFIGSGAYAEFFNWRKEADLPDPEQLLDGAVQFQHNKARLDRTAAVLASAAALITPTDAPRRAERAKTFWNIIKPMTEDAADVCLGSVVSACGARLMVGQPVAYQVIAKMEPVMAAAGILRPAPQ